jgi:hypothetical protein
MAEDEQLRNIAILALRKDRRCDRPRKERKKAGRNRTMRAIRVRKITPAYDGANEKADQVCQS